MNRVRLVLFAKAPQPGLAKTRLIPALGAEGAAQLAARMLAHTLEQAQRADCAELELCLSPPLSDPSWNGWTAPSGVQVTVQENGDLGARLASAATRAFADGLLPILIGTDCPELDAALLRAAARALDEHELVIHGTHDGGYALLGMAQETPELFRNIDWSSERVFAQTLARARAAHRQVHVLRTLADIDTPKDLALLPPGWLPD